MRYTYACISEAGPRTVNEDAVGVWQLGDDRLMAAVADGLGGMGGGDLASSIAISRLGSLAEQVDRDPAILDSIARDIHEEIKSRHGEVIRSRGMATTLSAIVLHSGNLFGIHCGDTRILLARSRGIKRLTRDHSEAARFYEQGKISLAEYRAYPRKNVLYSALGALKEPEIQSFEFKIEVGDWILIASDGIHQRVSTAALRDLAKTAESPPVFCSGLQKWIELRGATDNYSAVVIRVES